MRPVTGRNGFALPMTLFLISIITLMLTAAFAKVQSDRRIAEGSGANVNALALAKAGIQLYMGSRPFNSPGSPASPWQPPDGDSVSIALAGGYADVIARVVRKPADSLANWIYVIRSTGHMIDPTQGADPQAVRTIAQFAQWQTGQMDIRAAYTAANQISVASAFSNYSVTISGVDFNGTAPDVAGARAPSGSQSIPGTTGPNGSATDWITQGTPVNDKPGSSTPTSIAQATNIDWDAIVSGGFTPDYTTIQNSGADQWNYTSQMVVGNATFNGQGSGLLIVTGDLTYGAGAEWYGVILVGGRIIFGSNSRAYGAVSSGLNAALGSAVTATVLGDQNVYIQYNSSFVELALAKLTGFAPIPNGWVDNWAQY